MFELTVSRKKKISTGKYENEEIMAAIKAEYPDTAKKTTELEMLNATIEAFLTEQERQIRHRLHTSTKKTEE